MRFGRTLIALGVLALAVGCGSGGESTTGSTGSSGSTSGGSTGGTSGSGGSSGGTTGGGNVPSTPTASEGQAVFNTRDGSTDQSFQCDGSSLTVTYGPSGANTQFLVVCYLPGTGGDRKQVTFSVQRPTLPAGSYALSSTNNTDPALLDSFGIAVIEGGTGFAVGQTASPAPNWLGTLQLDEVGTGAGAHVSGSFKVWWDKVGTVTNGAVNGQAARTGGLASAFRVTLAH